MTNLKDATPSDATSCISSTGDAATATFKDNDLDNESLPTDQPSTHQTASYYGYYYPGFDTSCAESDDQGYFVPADGLELHHPVVQADGSLVYVMPAFQPGYSSFRPYLPINTFGVDGQFLGQQPYSPSPMFQPSVASPAFYPTALPYVDLVPSPYLWDPSLFVGDVTYRNNQTGIPETPGSKPSISSASHARAPPSKKLLHSDFSNPSEINGSLPSVDVSSGYDVHNQLKSASQTSQHGSIIQPDALGKGYFPFAKFPLYNQRKGGLIYSNSPVHSKANARVWDGTEKPKTRRLDNGVNQFNDFSLPSEQNNVHRTTNAKGASMSGGNAAGPLATEANGNNHGITSLIIRDQYNLSDFPAKFDHAFFFVIKSYSEDDIHKSIKYNVWASTPNGNKRLDTAYEEAQSTMVEKGSKCPVFLFFSVNASGQFCGVAEMIGRVDFNRNMDFWQQDKWNGYFPVKWHMIKDIPNPQLRHIILENNDKKPVTNSRDTQEVRFTQGIEMLNIFKNYASKTSILDDFDFYESRQKVMQEKKIRPSIPHFVHIQQKADELATSLQSVDLSATENVEEPYKG